MNILVLSIEYPPIGGGASPMAHQVNVQYTLMGHQVTVVTMHTGDLPIHEIMDGVEIIRLKCFRRHTHISYFWEHIAFLTVARKRLHQLLRKQSFDVCHSHFLLPTGILARWVKRKFGIPYVITAHGSDVPGYNPDRFGYFHLFTPRLIQSIIHHSDHIIAPSRYLLSLIQKVYKENDGKLIFIPSGINPDFYFPGEKKPILLSTGRLLLRKGFQFLIRTVHDEAFPFVVHICGDGPLLKSLKEQALGSKTPIVFHGWIDNNSKEYRSLLAEAAIFSLISAKENASTSLLEAMAAGCAVITSNVSGCPESVGEAGICLPPGDVVALKMQLRKLVEEPAYAQKLMLASRKRAIDVFAWPSIASKYVDLLSKMKS